MKTKHQYLLLFYWVALLAYCYCIYEGKTDYQWLAKGALMPLLILYYIVNASRRHHLRSRILTVTALVFAWAGDIVLLQEGEQYFIIGLVLFLLMHLVYIIYFFRVHKLFPIKDTLILGLPLLLVAIYDAVLMSQLLEDSQAQQLKVPLFAYMAVLSLMLVAACNILDSKKSKSLAFQYFIPGAVLFIVSDSLLGLNKFIWAEQIVGIPVILTYGYAQQLIVHGFIKHVKGRV
jgi:uncharacterized membrane protein YhhN